MVIRCCVSGEGPRWHVHRCGTCMARGRFLFRKPASPAVMLVGDAGLEPVTRVSTTIYVGITAVVGPVTLGKDVVRSMAWFFAISTVFSVAKQGRRGSAEPRAPRAPAPAPSYGARRTTSGGGGGDAYTLPTWRRQRPPAATRAPASARRFGRRRAGRRRGPRVQHRRFEACGSRANRFARRCCKRATGSISAASATDGPHHHFAAEMEASASWRNDAPSKTRGWPGTPTQGPASCRRRSERVARRLPEDGRGEWNLGQLG